MDYEKKYKDALERAKSLYNSVFVNNDILNQIFPELEESEDEKIRKEIIQYLKDYPNLPNGNYSRDDFFAWLEKQGNKKDYKPQGKTALQAITEEIANNPDKPKSKFKIGDWIVNIIWKNPLLIKSVNNGFYSYEDNKGNYMYPCLPPLENEFHLWTIEDAKDGDILVSNNDPFIFKGLLDPKNPGCPVAYCGLDINKDFIVGDGNDGGTNHWSSNEEIKPATKEQRDLLFEKMKEYGYEWDSDRKKLIEIEVEAQDD